MRRTFVNRLKKLAHKDKRIYLLTGDVGFSYLEEFQASFPQRYLNCGVAEQNMIGVAAGLALSGKKPYVYSIVPFVTMRCLEQIRNDIAIPKLDIKLVGFGAGLTYGSHGSTHHSITDIGIMRTLPNITVLSPGDPIEADKLTLQSYATKNPTYLRLANQPDVIHPSNQKIKIGKPSIIQKGKQAALIVHGFLLTVAQKVTAQLSQEGHDITLISLPTLKPIDTNALLACLKGIKVVLTLEEHNIIGGLGSAVAEILSESSYQGYFKRLGVPDIFVSQIGSSDYLRQSLGLSQKSVLKELRNHLKKT